MAYKGGGEARSAQKGHHCHASGISKSRDSLVEVNERVGKSVILVGKMT